AALGSLGLDDYAVSSERVLRSGISATRWLLDERLPPRAGPPQEGAPPRGRPPRGSAIPPPAPPRHPDRAAHRPIGPGARVTRSRHRAGPPAGGHRGGDPPDAGPGRGPARGRRPRSGPRPRR